MSFPAYLACLVIRLYQLTLSWLAGNCCRFEPSCSNYALGAFGRHGFLAGALLTVWRLLRCHPFCRGGFDPVPADFRCRDLFARSRPGMETEPP